MPVLVMNNCPRCQYQCPTAIDTASGLCTCPQCGLRFDPAQARTGTVAQAVTPACATGSNIAGYQLLRLLGTGGMSEVWAASSAERSEPIALKILLRQHNQDPELRARFQREVEALQQLDHPGIVRVLDHGEHEGRPYLVGDLVAERSLRDDLRSHEQTGRRHGLNQVHRIATEVLQALAHAHSRGCVHRDLKPENLLLDAQGRVRICDFGIARLQTGTDGRTLTQLTRTDAVLGTLAYMAPEQRGASHQVDRRCDLYALGMVLYECLSGHRPEGRFEEPSQFLEHVPPATAKAWNTFLLQLLARDPADRPTDASSALADLPPPVPGQAVTTPADRERFPHGQRLLRDPQAKKIGGICAGVATLVGTQIWPIRVLMVLGTLMTGGLLALGYAAGCVVIPLCPDPPYRPRPLNQDWPKRHAAWLGGICALLARQTQTPAWAWRLGAVFATLYTSWLAALAYGLAMLVLPKCGQPLPPPVAPSTPAAKATPTPEPEPEPEPEPDQRGRTWFIAAVLLGACGWGLGFAGTDSMPMGRAVLYGAAILSICAAILPSLTLFRSRIGAALAGMALWSAPALALAATTRELTALAAPASIWLILLLLLAMILRRYAALTVALTLGSVSLLALAHTAPVWISGLAASGTEAPTMLLAMLPSLWLTDGLLGLMLGKRAWQPGFSLAASMLALVSLIILLLLLDLGRRAEQPGWQAWLDHDQHELLLDSWSDHH